jgi:PAS domain S-box-containing protein
MHFFAGERIQELQIYFEKIRRGQEIKKLEMRIKNTRGETLECEINALPLIENAQVTGVLNVARDITERIRVERALRESEEKYRVLLETSLRHTQST